MLDQEAITQQLELLAAHRRTLAHLIEQAAQFGGEIFAPPQTANGIAEARQQIRRIKAVLRKNGAQVEDDPNDKAPRQRKPVQSPLAGDVVSGDKVAGDKVGGDKVMGDKRTINTEGGNYAEGNIDKRQGAFISGSTIYGPVVGVNQGSVTANYTVQQRPDPALHQLRAPVDDFVGREREINWLVQALSKATTGGAAASISGVRGMGGIGKSELAYVVANRLKDAFPDAQLVIELRGASSSPLTSAQALQQAIRSFEREVRLPDDVGQLQGLYNSVLAGKRVLVLADDAHNVGQVRPLLPPPGCALLVTSRSRFSLPGMAVVDLGTLPPGEAEKLVLTICPRIGQPAPRLAKLCGYLPLALRVSAGMLETNDIRAVAHYLEQLEVERLKHLSDPDDPHASVEASLRLSYDVLKQEAQSALCQLSVFRTSFNLEKATAVVDVEGDVVEVLELLRRRSLLEWDAGIDSFFLHDLVKAFGMARLPSANEVRSRVLKYHHMKIIPLAIKLYLLIFDLCNSEVFPFDSEMTYDLLRTTSEIREVVSLAEEEDSVLLFSGKSLFPKLSVDVRMLAHYNSEIANIQRHNPHIFLVVDKIADVSQKILNEFKITANEPVLRQVYIDYHNLVRRDKNNRLIALSQLQQRLTASHDTPPAEMPSEG